LQVLLGSGCRTVAWLVHHKAPKHIRFYALMLHCCAFMQFSLTPVPLCHVFAGAGGQRL
jgi:hypothetical protein